MKDASNKSSTSSDPGVLDSPNVVVVEPSDRMLIDTNEAVVYIAASVIDTECTCIK